MMRTRSPAGQGFGRIIRRRTAPWLGALAVLSHSAAAAPNPPGWTRPTAAFPITRDIWYVGTEGLAAYLIKTRAGAILIDATLAENVPAIERNIVAAGVPLKQVRLLLVSHAHFDHAAGDARMKRDTGAKVVAGAGDAAALESGFPPGETSYGVIRFPPVKVDRAVRDGERVSLGGKTLTTVATPGHTPGCTTWTMTSGGSRVVFPCSVSVAGNRLVGNRRYPGIVADFRTSFARLAALPADIVLPAHPELADVLGKHRRGAGFEDPQELARMVGTARAAFARDLAKQEATR